MTDNEREMFQANTAINRWENIILAISIASGLITLAIAIVAIMSLSNNANPQVALLILGFYVINSLAADYARYTIKNNIHELHLHKMEILQKMTAEELSAFRRVDGKNGNNNESNNDGE